MLSCLKALWLKCTKPKKELNKSKLIINANMQEKIYFKDAQGRELCGIISSPSKDSSTPLIILCHGFSTSKNSFTSKELEKIFNKNNIATIRFDFFGHGESEGEIKDITITKAVDNLLQVIKFSKERGFTKIGLVGSSFGGHVCIMAAPKAENVVALALKCPVADYLERELEQRTPEELKEWKEKRFKIYTKSNGETLKINYAYFEDFKNNRGYEAAKLINVPTLIVHGDADSSVPIKQSRKIAKILENCTLKEIAGADHWFKGPGEFETMIKFISEFMIEKLKQ